MTQDQNSLPPLDSIFNLYDFKFIASKVLPNQVYTYYSSSADDEVSYRGNHYSFSRIFFKPKILVDVTNIDIKTEILNTQLNAPFYISATTLCRLGNPMSDGLSTTEGCSELNLPQTISTFSFVPLEDIAAACNSEKQVQWFQLYVNSDRKLLHELVIKAENLGMKALFVTVDAPQAGNRERNFRFKFSVTNNNGLDVVQKKKQNRKETNGASKSLSKLIAIDLTWEDIKVFKSLTNMPIVLKGV